ncbi:hypothetical protein [Flavobacterium sp. JP2137]|uniref:hypothetical protein n=1 Tax=Flavobacterium sp. JP2137 TaxID=3414510 RepID=UPI003D2FE8C1
MRIVYNPYFLGLLLVGTSIYILQRCGVILPDFVQYYINDLLVMPLVLWVVLAFLKMIHGAQARISWAMAVPLVVFYSLFFECYLPTFHPRYTADGYDVLCYAVGALVFMWFQHRIKP